MNDHKVQGCKAIYKKTLFLQTAIFKLIMTNRKIIDNFPTFVALL